MTKVVIENKEVLKFSEIGKGEFFKHAVEGGKFFVKCDTIESYWNSVCVDPTGTMGWHSNFSPDDQVILVSEVLIKV